MNRCLFPWKLSSVFSTLGTFLKSCDKRIHHGFEKMQILKIVIALLRKLGKILQQKSLVYYALSNMLTSSKIFARTSSVIFARRKVVCRLNHSGTTVFFKENVRYPTWACGDPIRVPKTPQKNPGYNKFQTCKLLLLAWSFTVDISSLLVLCSEWSCVVQTCHLTTTFNLLRYYFYLRKLCRFLTYIVVLCFERRCP